MKIPNIVKFHLINTPLQRGAGTSAESKNRFNGFGRDVKTVETVSVHLPPLNTPLKRGVNESGFRAMALEGINL
jgi:hypothetical protein